MPKTCFLLSPEFIKPVIIHIASIAIVLVGMSIAETSTPGKGARFEINVPT